MSDRADLRKGRKRRLTRRRAIAGLTSALGLTGAAVATNMLLSPAGAASEFPTPKTNKSVTETISVSGTLDGGLKRYFGSGALGDGGQDEGQDPMFALADGAVLKNVIIGAPAADGIHCKGSCTLQNVWWEDVGEDAATFKGGTDDVYTVTGGGAKNAADKVFQHNGGGKLTISDFAVQGFKTLYRSCGNCKTQHKRSVTLENITVTAPGSRLAGINTNHSDTATLREITIIGDSKKKIVPCQKYIGNNKGDEPTKIGEGPDSTNCLSTTSDITYK
jgi:hypothetical protein